MLSPHTQWNQLPRDGKCGFTEKYQKIQHGDEYDEMLFFFDVLLFMLTDSKALKKAASQRMLKTCDAKTVIFSAQNPFDCDRQNLFQLLGITVFEWPAAIIPINTESKRKWCRNKFWALDNKKKSNEFSLFSSDTWSYSLTPFVSSCFSIFGFQIDTFDIF